MSDSFEGDFEGVVLDFGSGLSKLGFIGENEPRVVIPTVVGYAMMNPQFTGRRPIEKRMYCGVGTQNLRSKRFPIEHGLANDYENLKRLILHSLHNELGVTTSKVVPKIKEDGLLFADFKPELCLQNQPVFLLESPSTPKSQRERITDIMFDEIGVPSLYLCTQTVASLFTSGKTTGFVIESGDGVSHTSGVIEGHILRKTLQRSDIAGSIVSDYLIRLLSERGYEMITNNEREWMRIMKEKICHLSLDFQKDFNLSKTLQEPFETEYLLPDGLTMSVGHELFTSPEILFNPSLLYPINKSDERKIGIHKCIAASLRLVENENLRNKFLQNIFLSGGTTHLIGFQDRIEKEIKTNEMFQCITKKENPVTITPSKNVNSAWIGGSIFGSLDSYRNNCMKIQEYEEFGVNILQRKCPISMSEIREKNLLKNDNSDLIERLEFLKIIMMETKKDVIDLKIFDFVLKIPKLIVYF